MTLTACLAFGLQETVMPVRTIQWAVFGVSAVMMAVAIAGVCAVLVVMKRQQKRVVRKTT